MSKPQRQLPQSESSSDLPCIVHEVLRQYTESLPSIIRQVVKEEYDFQKQKLQPLAHAARLIGISPTTAHNYKRTGLLNRCCDRFGKVVPADLLRIHLSQP